MSNEEITLLRDNVANIRGELAVLKELIFKTVTQQLIDVRVQALNAEAVANKLYEQMQSFVSQQQEAQFDSGDAEYGEAGVDVRSGELFKRKTTAVKTDEPS